MDKSNWPDGPWMDEPDRDQWTDEATGLKCLIRRHDAGYLCGYVAVPDSHPWHGADFTDLGAIDVHGGINWSALGDDKEITWTEGTPDGLWWIGFDCGHAGSLVPAGLARMGDLGQAMCSDIYRDLRFVRREVTGLAQQVKDAEGAP